MSTPNTFPMQLLDNKNTLIIDADDTQSSAFECGGVSVGGLFIPDGFTNANLTFQTSMDGAIFYDVVDPSGSGSPLTVAASENQHIPLDPSVFAFVKYIKVISSETQTTAQTIQILAGPVWGRD